jgi:predicted nucleotidyltransferase component of viral defense system
MAVIPLYHKLRRSIHRKIALAQDIIIMKLYERFPEAVLHGGTAIWRCYGSNRFSEDIDIYLPPKNKSRENLEMFLKSLEQQGFSLAKFKMTDNGFFSKLMREGVEVRLEAVFKSINASVKQFELSDSTFTNVYTLQPEELIMEKMAAYKKRKKVRDLYDIYFLLRFVSDRKFVEKYLRGFSGSFENPVDPDNIKAIIISGAVPDAGKLIREIRIWAK